MEKEQTVEKCLMVIGDSRKVFIREDAFDTAISNPPFSLSQDIVDRLLYVIKPGGYIWILQRCDWLASIKRSQWHEKVKCLRHVCILTKRPTWEIDGRPNNSADTRDYAWFGYCVGWQGKPTVEWLFKK